jgi:hypothetical protein
MATILEFRMREETAGADVDVSAPTQFGEVIIFPGVRYERYEEQPTPPAARVRARRTRHHDRLELDE